MVNWGRHGAASGFATVYRLERLLGRDAEATPARSTPVRWAHNLAGSEPVDLWVLLRRYRDYVPFVDVSSASTGYMPMAEGAEYAVSISASGLVVRPANDAARGALGSRR
jgi:hypothetical protein